YADRHGIFRINREHPNGHTRTPCGRALAGREIEAIHAHPPTGPPGEGVATARHQRHRQRQGPPAGVHRRLQPRFAVSPSSDEDAHRSVLHSARALGLLLSEQEAGNLSKNRIVPYRNTAYQVRHQGPGYRLRGAKVTVCALASGEIVLLHEGRELP
ncbi:MAG: hypothetical protein KA204_02845, partial [Chromatiaceae bacterium]|nr:hypothetical protein [Chromatiaceae bacterium]MBP6733893.1 hypothetical protein [Chromatiaceae bacterium]MBP6806848.1 hypothetical protein [Chromatiaceae bacterium]MBP8288510.1 hypothetical protein [Chromatiaceae bacterium]MBP9602933.1 hypothetical protein [Chromatiaceae bacterium]